MSDEPEEFGDADNLNGKFPGEADRSWECSYETCKNPAVVGVLAFIAPKTVFIGGCPKHYRQVREILTEIEGLLHE